MVACAILWLFIQASLADQGVPPRSRGSLRYQRRKARKLGLRFDQVEVRPRIPTGWKPSEPIGDSHVGDLTWTFRLMIGGFLAFIVGAVLLAPIDVSWSIVWLCAVMIGMLVLQRRRVARFKREKEL